MLFFVLSAGYRFYHILSLQCDIIIVILGIARNIFHHLNEWREVYILMLSYSLGFQYHQVVNWLLEGIQLEILSLPDKALAVLADGGTIRICLLQHRFIEIGIDLTLCLNLLLIRNTLLGCMYVHIFSTLESTYFL